MIENIIQNTVNIKYLHYESRITKTHITFCFQKPFQAKCQFGHCRIVLINVIINKVIEHV